MFPAGPVSSGASNFRPRPRRIVAKNLSIMHLVLLVRQIRPVPGLPTAVPRRLGPRVQRLVLLVRKAPRRGRLARAGLVDRAEPDGREDFRVLVARPAPVDRVVVLVVRPVRVALVVRPVVLAVPPVRA